MNFFVKLEVLRNWNLDWGSVDFLLYFLLIQKFHDHFSYFFKPFKNHRLDVNKTGFLGSL